MLARRLQPAGILDRDLELRHLPHGVHYEITQLLDCNNNWREIMARIRKESMSSAACPYKYSGHDIKIVEKAAVQQRRSCTEIFLSEWGTSGRRRPTLSTLFELLKDAHLFRAADYVADLLGEDHPPRPAETPAALVDVSDEAIAALIARRENNNLGENNISDIAVELASDAPQEDNPRHEPIVPPETGVISYPYKVLESLTNRFNADELVDTPTGRVKRQLGAGGFGSVFLAKLPRDKYVAVKKLHMQGAIPILPAQFNYEVQIISQIRHPNLLSLVGYSNDGLASCLLYEYLDGGNLQVRLANKEDPLPWLDRMKIAESIAKGLDHLHTAPGGPFVHRDVKSANILLSSSGDVKLGDFGLIRWGPSKGNTHEFTSSVVGSTDYMAEEVFRGQISIKMDTYSFGVVLIELVTALPPSDESREDRDLVSYFKINCINSFGSLLDESAGHWPSNVIDEIFELTTKCVDSKYARPVMTEVKRRISEILQQHIN